MIILNSLRFFSVENKSTMPLHSLIDKLYISFSSKYSKGRCNMISLISYQPSLKRNWKAFWIYWIPWCLIGALSNLLLLESLWKWIRKWTLEKLNIKWKQQFRLRHKREKNKFWAVIHWLFVSSSFNRNHLLDCKDHLFEGLSKWVVASLILHFLLTDGGQDELPRAKLGGHFRWVFFGLRTEERSKQLVKRASSVTSLSTQPIVNRVLDDTMNPSIPGNTFCKFLVFERNKRKQSSSAVFNPQLITPTVRIDLWSSLLPFEQKKRRNKNLVNIICYTTYW
jgi:hypothetical protein